MSLPAKISEDGWTRLMAGFGLSAEGDTYRKLIAAYSETHRHYHMLAHIEACFWHLEASEDLAETPREIELALWFHDAVYKPMSETNEEDSAEWARDFLAGCSVDADITTRIYDLIILTKDHQAPDTGDGALMLDIDLSILGAPADVYAQFETNIRREYKRVPGFLFRRKRKEILQGFAARPRLYHTDYFYERLEHQAKTNLAAAIADL